MLASYTTPWDTITACDRNVWVLADCPAQETFVASRVSGSYAGHCCRLGFPSLNGSAFRS